MTGKVFARFHSLAPQTLANWRYQDRKAGRTTAGPGFPQYRRFGKAVRYRLEDPLPAQQQQTGPVSLEAR